MYSKDHKAGDGLVVYLRPGFRKLLKELAQKYELVIFSKEDTNFLTDVIKTIDPYQMYFPFYFGNEFLLVKTNGMYRDMSYLNRDPKKTVIIDFEKDSYLLKIVLICSSKIIITEEIMLTKCEDLSKNLRGNFNF